VFAKKQGLIALLAFAFLIYRCTKRNRRDDDVGDDEIKWPEFQQVSGTSVLNPSNTRQTGLAGIGDETEEYDGPSTATSYDPSAGSSNRASNQPGYGAAANYSKLSFG
jgi:hypothetical protein